LPLSPAVTSGKIAPMQPHRLLAVLVIAGALWAPREAAAFCDISGPYLGTGSQLPLGCPFHVYGSLVPPPSSGTLIPTITVLRNGTYVDVTGAYTSDTLDLPVTRTFVDCRGNPTTTVPSLETYQHFAIPPLNVQVGEEIGFGRNWFIGIKIVAAATCPAPLVPMPVCMEVQQCFPGGPFGDDVVDNGCQARGGAGLAAGAALLALLRWAPRRRRCRPRCSR
jgi:hypothetical protein